MEEENTDDQGEQPGAQLKADLGRQGWAQEGLAVHKDGNM